MQQRSQTNPQDDTTGRAGGVILFDGVCNMCNTSVNYVIDHDPAKSFLFASLQSEVGTSLAKEHGIDASELSSMVLIEDGRAYQRSTAAIRVARKLSGPAKLLWPFIVVPAFLRDPFYRFIAKRRYKWFGKREACRLPTESDRVRFL
ncbi:MAG: thiol-disulfide oxidoreductase DCC family protein [Phycisphaeraceae bacterium]